MNDVNKKEIISKIKKHHNILSNNLLRIYYNHGQVGDAKKEIRNLEINDLRIEFENISLQIDILWISIMDRDGYMVGGGFLKQQI